MRWPIGAHWADKAYPEAIDLGFSWCFVSATDLINTSPDKVANIQEFIASGLDFVLATSWHTESMLLNSEGAWDQYLYWVRDAMWAHGLMRRCLAAIYDDEFLSRLWAKAGDHAVFPPAIWPNVSRCRPNDPGVIAEAAHILADRMRDMRRIFGADMPPGGIGLSETEAYDWPNVVGQDFWSLDLYRGRPGWYIPTTEKVHEYYAAAAEKGLRLMPVIPVFSDGGHAAVSVGDLAECYLPLLERHGSRIDWLAVFCLHHPSQYDARHEANGHKGRGILQLPYDRRDAVRWLTRTYGQRRRTT